MDTRKMEVTIFGFISILVIAGFLLGSVTQAGAETLKSKNVVTATKTETIPVNDEPGHILGMGIYEGLALFENGEIAKLRTLIIFDAIPGKGAQAIGYNIFTFEDGSTIVARSQRLEIADQSGNLSAKVTGEIMKGTGRFQGIKGTASATGENFKPSKEEAERVFTEFTLTYTLPSK